MEFKAKPSLKLKIVIGDKSFEIEKPKMRHQIDLEKATRAAQLENKPILEPMIEWIVGLGMPRDAALDMDQEQFLELVSYVSGSKKN